MGYTRQTSLAATEPVSLVEMKQFLRVPSAFTDDDTQIGTMISAAREYAETIQGRCLAQRNFTQVLDSFPYFTDTIQSQLAYPPSYYSLPRYSTTLWNYSQMIKLSQSPVISVTQIRYVGTDGSTHILLPDVDFVLDRTSEPARIFPMPGQYWPPCLYVPNAVEIDYVAGYDPDPAAVSTHNVVASPPSEQPASTVISGITQRARIAIQMLVAYWYDQRPGDKDVPPNITNLLYSDAIVDWAPSRG